MAEGRRRRLRRRVSRGLLRDLGVGALGFDLAVPALLAAPRHAVCAGDVLAPPFRPGAFDAVLCLGNTVSLLPDRAAQRRVLAVLGALLRPGGVLVLQGEDAARNVARGPVVRTRRIDAETVHVRLFERRGRRVRMLAGVAPAGGEAPVEETLLLPTTAGSITRSAGHLGLGPVDLPAPPPGGGAAWWAALVKTGARGPGSGVRATHPPGENTKDGMTKVWVRPSVRSLPSGGS